VTAAPGAAVFLDRDGVLIREATAVVSEVLAGAVQRSVMFSGGPMDRQPNLASRLEARES
jgi:hypothetical protein